MRQLKNAGSYGSDLIAQGMQPGKQIGEVLNMLLNRVIENPEENTRENLLKTAEEWKDKNIL